MHEPPSMLRLASAIALTTLFVTLGACASTDDEAESAEAAVERSRGRPLSNAQIERIAKKLGTELVSRFEQINADLARPAPSCDARQASDYVANLIAVGRANEAATWSERCVAESARPSFKLLAAASDAAVADFEPQKALAFAERAARESAGTTNEREAAFVYVRAIGAAYNSLPSSKMHEVLAPFGRDRDLVFGVLTGGAVPDAVQRDLIRLSEVRANASFSVPLRMTLVDVMISTEYRYHDALRILDAYSADLKVAPASSLASLIRLVERALMNHGDQAVGIPAAKSFMQGLVPFQRPDSGFFLSAYSPVDYSQLPSECPDSFAKGSTRTQLDKVKSDWREGRLSADAALAALRALGPNLADVQTTVGSIQFGQGDFKESLASFWSARQSCPWYGRATAGTSSAIFRLQRAKRVDAFRAGSLSATDTELLSAYVSNWSVLTRRQQENIATEMKFWRPYVSALSAASNTMYVSPIFEKVSETRTIFASDSADEGRGEDGRLDQDVKGLGGKQILVGSEHLGDFQWAVVVHEAAHQFHSLATRNTAACISLLYREAKARNDFSIGYAATNEYEYFAMGVAHLAEPGGYVWNPGWYDAHDARLKALVESVRASNGDFAAVACPHPIGPGQAELAPVDDNLCWPSHIDARNKGEIDRAVTKLLCAMEKKEGFKVHEDRIAENVAAFEQERRRAAGASCMNEPERNTVSEMEECIDEFSIDIPWSPPAAPLPDPNH